MSPPVLFFFKIVLAIQCPLSFFIHFRMGFSISGKNSIEILLGIALNMQITLDTTNILLRNIKYVSVYLCLISFNKIFSFHFASHLLPRLSYFFLLKRYLFIYFWLRWVFVAAHGLSLVTESAQTALGCSARASLCCGFSCYRAQALGAWLQQLQCVGSRLPWFQELCHRSSLVMSRALERRSLVVACGLQLPTACGIFSDQKLNQCPLHCKADSYPL